VEDGKDKMEKKNGPFPDIGGRRSLREMKESG